MKTYYSTLDEFVAREIIDPIMAGGAVSDAEVEFDVEAICEEMCEVNSNGINLSFCLRDEFCDYEKYWDTVFKHQRELKYTKHYGFITNYYQKFVVYIDNTDETFEFEDANELDEFLYKIDFTDVADCRDYRRVDDVLYIDVY